MDKSTRNAIERATQQARKLLDDDFSSQLEGTFDVLRSGVIASSGGVHLSARQQFQREKIVAAIDHKRASGMTASEAVVDYVRDAAFTTLNRFIALKMLEARELVQECITKGEQSAGYREFCGMAPGLALIADAAGYRLYVESLFDEFSTEIKVLFDRSDVASILWPKRQTFEGLLAILNAIELKGVWGEDETIGWVYQFFNSGEERRKMRDESQVPRNSRELAVRNQFFTPRYVVQFLVDNTLGRLWLEMHGEQTALVNICEYLLRSADEPPLSRPRKDPRDLRILDPACGSGHFLLYSFDLLLNIYEDAWSAEGPAPRCDATAHSLLDDYPDIAELRLAVPRLIVENNLHGVDIDPRCAQIAALALWLRAQRAWKDAGIRAADRPRIARTHIVVAEPIPGDTVLVDQFATSLNPPLLRDLFKKMVGESHLAGELGVLLRMEEGIASELSRARDQFVKQRGTTAYLPGMEPAVKQGSLDLSGIDNDSFFHEAETRIVDALRGFSESASGSTHVRRSLFADDAAQGVALIDLVRSRFDVILMNPPFGELPEAGKNLLGKARARRPFDAYTQFLYRSVELLSDRGYVGAIVSKTFMTHAEFEITRRWMLSEEGSLRVFVELGSGVLDAAVEVAAITLSPGVNDKAKFFDLIMENDKGQVLKSYFGNADSSAELCRKYSQFLSMPGAPLAYRLSADAANSIAQEATLSDFVEGAWGLFTAADDRFLRAWWEVEPDSLGSTWMPFAKGGTPLAFFAEPLLVVRWEDEGAEILSRKGDKGQVLARAPNKDKYGMPGLTYSSISASGLRVRPLSEGVIFSIKGPALFPRSNREKLLPLMEMLNTGEVSYLLSSLSSNRSAELNYALRISIPRDWGSYFSGKVARELFRLQRWFATGSETSRYFLGYPIERDENGAAGEIIAESALENLNEAGKLAFSRIGLNDEAVESYRPRTQHLSSPPNADSHAVLSHLVGVAFGRWHPSVIEPREAEGTLSDEFSALPRVPCAAANAILRSGGAPNVLAEDAGHVADIVALVSAQAEKLNIHDPLILDRDVARKYIREEFFSNHIIKYSESSRRAPIYWQLSIKSAKYSLWTYYLSLTKDTIYALQNEFVVPKLIHEERKLSEMKAEFGVSPASSMRKDLLSQESFIEELRDLLNELKIVAPLWNPNIGDGVILTMAPLWRLVPQNRSWQTELKKKWEELIAGQCDWSGVAMHLWPERVVPKCALDRSLSIAHGLQDVFWVDTGGGKWKPRQTPSRNIEELVRERTSIAVKTALKSLTDAPTSIGQNGRTRSSSS
jgi:hypothetical protein